MILQALTAYYEALLAQGKLSAPGWADPFPVSYELEVDDRGALIDVIDCRENMLRGKKTVLAPRQMRVPAHVKRASGVAANFLCDNATYLLGADEKGKPERARQCFAACAALHHALLDAVDDPAARAVLAFFDTWQPEQAATHPLLAQRWKDIAGSANLVFTYDDGGSRRPVTERPAFQNAWQQHYQQGDPDAAHAQCLVTGLDAPVARTHPAIKGVRGAQSSGAALVSFNAPAFCSYGHEQNANAPVGTYAAFAYTTALNTLLADPNHRQMLGDTTVVCWAENASSACADLGMAALFGAPKDSGIQEERSRSSPPGRTAPGWTSSFSRSSTSISSAWRRTPRGCPCAFSCATVCRHLPGTSAHTSRHWRSYAQTMTSAHGFPSGCWHGRPLT